MFNNNNNINFFNRTNQFYNECNNMIKNVRTIHPLNGKTIEVSGKSNIKKNRTNVKKKFMGNNTEIKNKYKDDEKLEQLTPLERDEIDVVLNDVVNNKKIKEELFFEYEMEFNEDYNKITNEEIYNGMENGVAKKQTLRERIDDEKALEIINKKNEKNDNCDGDYDHFLTEIEQAFDVKKVFDIADNMLAKYHTMMELARQVLRRALRKGIRLPTFTKLVMEIKKEINDIEEEMDKHKSLLEVKEDAFRGADTYLGVINNDLLRLGLKPCTTEEEAEELEDLIKKADKLYAEAIELEKQRLREIRIAEKNLNKIKTKIDEETILENKIKYTEELHEATQRLLKAQSPEKEAFCQKKIEEAKKRKEMVEKLDEDMLIKALEEKRAYITEASNQNFLISPQIFNKKFNEKFISLTDSFNKNMKLLDPLIMGEKFICEKELKTKLLLPGEKDIHGKKVELEPNDYLFPLRQIEEIESENMSKSENMQKFENMQEPENMSEDEKEILLNDNCCGDCTIF